MYKLGKRGEEFSQIKLFNLNLKHKNFIVNEYVIKISHEQLYWLW